MGISPSLLCPSLRSTSPNTMQCSADSYLQKHQQGCAKQQSPHCSLLSSFSDTQKKNILCQTAIQRYSKQQCEHHTIAYPHACTYTHFYTENYPALSLSALSSYPSSCLHPAPRDNSVPFRQAGRQAVEGTAMDMFCLLSNERRNVTVGLSAGPGQPSIHTCGISTVYQTAG